MRMLHIRDIWKENPTQGKCYISIDFENNLGSAKIDHLLDTRKVTVYNMVSESKCS